MTGRLHYFAPCPKGVEPLLADELRRLGLRSVRPQRSGVLFAGTVADGLRAVYWSRLATRVLLTLAEVDASSADSLYEGVRDLTWEDHVRADGTIAVDATGVNDALRNTQFTAVRVKDAIADRFRDLSGERPSVDVRRPDLRVNVVLRAGKATISLDIAGEPLHRRGYREPGVQVEAPMKETLAAAVLEAAGWREVAASGGSFIDPLCGSGTLAIEAALIAGDVAPGLLRREHPAARWLGFDIDAWERIVKRAEAQRDAGLAALPVIAASDADPRAIDIARRFAKRAGLEFYIDIEQRDLAVATAPHDAPAGLLATNPPWGERLSDRASLAPLYSTLAERMESQFADWRVAVVSPDPALAHALGFEPASRSELGTGKGAITLSVFSAERTPTPRPATRAEAAAGAAPAGGEGAEAFGNRVRKMAKHFGKWARRTGVTCYRVYDADLPEYAVAIDLYQGAGPDEGKRWAHVAEYAPPHEIDPEIAAARVADVVAELPDALGVDPDNVFLKRRQRQRGSAQYDRVSEESVRGVVAENGLLFEVNLSDYLDTGIFLDHRDTRAWLRELSEGKRFLNLFAYTGTASVYAAAGGAASTMTVDLSPTYLEWAGRNLERNGFAGDEHALMQRDTAEFIERAKKRSETYDLIFCDPPTFSNSKRMAGTWDVQRDHAALIIGLSPLLAEDGMLVFSCNKRGFKMDVDLLRSAEFDVRDATARTIPNDFERRPGIHSCWTVSHAGSKRR